VAGRDWHPTPLTLAEAADILVLCCPGGPATRGIIGAAELRALGPEGLLINVARGSVVQEEALIAALEAGAIAGAGLDVFENEPTPDPRFAALRNVALSPHIGGSTREARARADAMMTETVLAHLGIA
jgi:glyoxylate reductase/hydroxypyruvate reductase 2